MHFTRKLTLYKDDAPPSEHIRYRDVANWKPGRILEIAYSSQTGFVLLDPDSGLATEVISSTTAHPIDILHQKNLGQESTAEVVAACNQSSQLWLKEIDRIYARLNEEHPDQVEAIQTAQSAWHHFHDAQVALVNINSSREGTLYPLLAAQQRMDMSRSFALNLARWGRS